jgi:hypothetical protein
MPPGFTDGGDGEEIRQGDEVEDGGGELDGEVGEKVAAVGRGGHCKHIYVKPTGQD